MKTLKLIITILFIPLLLTSCVDQRSAISAQQSDASDVRVIATSMATVEIMEKLGVSLVGVPDSNLSSLPDCYAELPRVGMAMTPDLEMIKSLEPDYVLGPVTLISDLLPKYEAAELSYGFLNLNNVAGMYRSIEDLGKLLDKEPEADQLVAEYEQFIKDYQANLANKPKQRVLILMGLPGSYIVATEHSYVGSLVKMAGAENVYAGTTQQFLSINTEDMLSKDPDIILRAAHALPDEVVAMFNEDFANNDIWQHFRSVEKGKVYDLDYKKFGMSAKFNYPEALADLESILYD